MPSPNFNFTLQPLWCCGVVMLTKTHTMSRMQNGRSCSPKHKPHDTSRDTPCTNLLLLPSATVMLCCCDVDKDTHHVPNAERTQLLTETQASRHTTWHSMHQSSSSSFLPTSTTLSQYTEHSPAVQQTADGVSLKNYPFWNPHVHYSFQKMPS